MTDIPGLKDGLIDVSVCRLLLVVRAEILSRVPQRGFCNPKREMLESFWPLPCDSDLPKTP